MPTKIKVNDLVVFNDSADAAIFRVTRIDGFQLFVVDADTRVKKPAEQRSDVSLAKKATARQLVNATFLDAAPGLAARFGRR
jgi:hypothetical protein